MFVVLILISWGYDLVWLFYVNDSSSESESDGGAQDTVRGFAMLAVWASFFWQIIVALVFWKDSLDFKRIIRS